MQGSDSGATSAYSVLAHLHSYTFAHSLRPLQSLITEDFAMSWTQYECEGSIVARIQKRYALLLVGPINTPSSHLDKGPLNPCPLCIQWVPPQLTFCFSPITLFRLPVSPYFFRFSQYAQRSHIPFHIVLLSFLFSFSSSPCLMDTV